MMTDETNELDYAIRVYCKVAAEYSETKTHEELLTLRDMRTNAALVIADHYIEQLNKAKQNEPAESESLHIDYETASPGLEMLRQETALLKRAERIALERQNREAEAMLETGVVQETNKPKKQRITALEAMKLPMSAEAQEQLDRNLDEIDSKIREYADERQCRHMVSANIQRALVWELALRGFHIVDKDSGNLCIQW